MARCPNFSHGIADQFLSALRLGATEAEALAHAGLDMVTLDVWKRRNPQFTMQIAQIASDGLLGHVQMVHAAARGDSEVAPAWRASVFLAERQASGMELTRLRGLTTDSGVPE